MMYKCILLTNEDLHKNKYPLTLIENNINNLNLYNILTTQTLTAEFCAKYFCAPNDVYAKDDVDQEIYIHHILQYQRHINLGDIEKHKNNLYY
jgi:hypothetical protein